jgi:hypothetical protein
MGYEDLAPLPLIIGEAGGRVTGLGGAPVLEGDGSVLASNGLIHDALIELAEDHGRCRGDLRELLDAAERPSGHDQSPGPKGVIHLRRAGSAPA